MIVVQVSHHNHPEVFARVDAHRAQPGSDLVLRLDVNVEREIEERAPPREVAGLRGTSALAGVDKNETLIVHDQVRVDGQRLGPVTVEKNREAAAPNWKLDVPGPVRGSDPKSACLDGVNGGHSSSNAPKVPKSVLAHAKSPHNSGTQ
jgi:hypothetical protein